MFAFGTQRVEANPYGTAPIELDAGVLQTCAFIVADGNVNCWGTTNVYGTTDDYLEGDAIGFGSGDWTNCVLLATGNTKCWGYRAGAPTGAPDLLSYTGGDAVQLSVGYGHSCVLTSAGNVNCGGDYLGGFPYHPVYSGGDAEWVVSSSYAACIKKAGTNILTCLGWNLPEPSWDTGGTPLPAAGGYYAPCILTAEGNVDCQDNNYNDVGQFAGYQGGDAIDTDAQFAWGCAATSTGDVHCWGHTPPTILGVDAHSVSVGGNKNICWSDSTGAVTCTNTQPDEYVGGAPPNQPPVANAGPDQIGIEWTAGLQVNLDGSLSYDPDDDTLTFSWTGDLGTASGATPTLSVPGLGTYTITLVVNDGTVDSGPDSVYISVVDTTAPTVTAALVPACDPEEDDDDNNGPCVPEVEEDEGYFQVVFSCTDTCDENPTITSATLNGIAVYNGQVVELELDDDEGQEVEWDDGILQIKASSFLLTVTCEDASGNEGTATASPQFADEDNEDEDDDADDNDSDDDND